MGVELILAATEADFSEKSASYIADCILRFQGTRAGKFILGLSGTNGDVRRARAMDTFKSLASKEAIDWSRVIVFLVDERFGFEQAKDCNAELVRGSLVQVLKDRGAPFSEEEQLVVPNTGLSSWEECARDYEQRLRDLFKRQGPPSLVTLGLASDDSIASIFPEWYREAPERWAQATSKEYEVMMTETSHFEVSRRIAVNLRIIRAAENIVVYLGGKEAEKGLDRAWPASMPDLEAKMADADSEGRTPRATIPHSVSELPPSVSTRNASPATHRSSVFKERRSLSMYDELSGQAASSTPVANRRPQWGRRRSADALGPSIAWVRGASPAEKTEPVDFSVPPPTPLTYVMAFCYVTVVKLAVDRKNHHTIIVFGAAGDLAKKKTLPAIFHLYLSRVLPTNVHIICCDDLAYHSDIRSTDDLWNHRLKEYLSDEGHTADLMDFKKHLEFIPIKLDDEEVMRQLDARIRELSGGLKDNRAFYLAQPPFLFEKSVRAIRQQCWSEPEGWVRVIVEKPFGRDLATAKELSSKLAAYLEERQIYRIDHYLAKTMVLNILTLRFANRELGRLFHADNVANVRITFKENIGVEGRAGYFDNYGIIRDVMQNHLLQLLTLVTMEAPASLEAEDVRNEKVKVLKQIRPVEIDDCVVGQYEGYQEDPDIQKVNAQKGFQTKCPTFATCVLFLDNERWSGVPLILKAGKHVDTRSTIVRLQFKKAPPNSLFGDQPQNELVLRVQPNEAIYYRMLAKTPGLSSRAHEVRRTDLDLDLRKLEVGRLPEAYEKLIHDVIQGEGHNFVRADEVEEGWRIFDPLLQHLESDEAPVPPSYPKGGRGPPEADELIESTGFRRYTKTGVSARMAPKDAAPR